MNFHAQHHIINLNLRHEIPSKINLCIAIDKSLMHMDKVFILVDHHQICHHPENVSRGTPFSRLNLMIFALLVITGGLVDHRLGRVIIRHSLVFVLPYLFQLHKIKIK